MYCAAISFGPRPILPSPFLPCCHAAMPLPSALNQLTGNRLEPNMDCRRQARPRKVTRILLRSVAVLGSIVLCEGLGVLSFGRRLTSCDSVVRVGRPLACQAVEGGGMEPGRGGIEQRESVGAGGMQHQPWPADAPTTSAQLLALFKVSTTSFKVLFSK